MIKTIKHNTKYNLIRLERNGLFEFYIEKIGYGHLFYVCGVERNIILSRDYVTQHIEFAEEENFWKE